MRDLERSSVEILISPCRLGIMNKLAKSDSGLTEKEIADQLRNTSVSFSRHLDRLIKAQIVRPQEGRYVLTNHGRLVYKTMQNIASAKDAAEVPA